MLSATNSPDSPCSPKILALCSDENIEKDRPHPSDRASSSSSEEDPADGPGDPQSLRFSIRDYVFTCRRKDVGNNWPFPQQYLQLCVKHGVGNFLPPFEPPDSVRARLAGVSEAAEDLVVPSGEEEEEEARTGLLNPVKRGVESPTQESVPGSPSYELQNPSSEDKSIVFQALACKDDSSTLVCPVPAFQETGTVSESSSAVEAVKASSLAENTRSSSELPTKKCRLIVTFGGAPDPHRSEEKVGFFSSVLDTMASKVCPVCKTFSSSSNTTLNAHIDQCLSSEASAKMDAVWPSQHKVRPRKKRSMEEIYATAARFTLEDLDRKNGTNWALELTSMSQNDEASPFAETKHPRISPLKRADNESKGAVYVDSNGTKLLILSKFNDARPSDATDCSGAENCIKQLKHKVSPFGKKKKIYPKYKKYLKTKIQTKKMNLFNRMKGEVHKNNQHQMNIHHDKRIYRGSNAADQMEVDNPGTLGQRICSKRSSLLKQLNGESSCRNLRNRLDTGNHVLAESNQSSLFCSFPAEKSIQRCHKSPYEMASTPNSVGTHASPDTLASSNGEQCSVDLHDKNARSIGKFPPISKESTMRCSRFTGKGICSTGSKNMEKCAHARRISRKRQKTSMDYHRLVHEGKMCSRRPLLTDVPQYEAETIKCNDVFQGIISKKPRKRRFVEKPHKAVKGLAQEAAEGFHGSLSSSGLNSTFNDVRSEMPQSSFSKNIVRSSTKDIHDKILPRQHDMMDSNEADPDYHPSDGEDVTLNNSHLGGECYHDEMPSSDAQVKLPKIDLLVNHPLCKMLDASENEILNPRDHTVCTSDGLAASFPLEHQLESSCVNEATNIPSATKLQGEKEMNVGVITDGVPHRKIQQVTQTEVTGKRACFSELQSIEYQADFSPIPSPSTCFNRPKDKILELGNILSVNSCGTAADEMHSLMVDRELVGSPVSATSTISHLSKDAERGSSEEPVVSPEKMKPDSMKMGFLMDDSIRWRTDMEETARNILEPELSCDAQPCCSSLTNSIHSKSKILTQGSMSGMMRPINIKHVSSSLYVTSTGTSSHSSAAARGIPILNPLSRSISAKTPPDFAMNLPTFSNFRSSSLSSHVQFQNTSPVLRLMGKNLMVMNKEERSAQQQGQAVSTSVNTINDMFLPGFSSTCCSSNPDSICYQSSEGSTPLRQQTSGTQVPILSPAEQVGHHSGTQLQSLWMATSHGHRNWLDKQPCSSSLHNLEKAFPTNEQKPVSVGQAPILERNIIAIDDSLNRKSRPTGSMQNQGNNVPPPLSFCYTSQNMYHWVDPGSSSKPTSPIQCPRREICPTSWVSASVSSAHPLPRHFIAPSSSANQLATTMYHSSHFQ